MILITGPKESTLADFWEMVCQDKVKQIIMLTNLREGRKVLHLQQNNIMINCSIFKHYLFLGSLWLVNTEPLE